MDTWFYGGIEKSTFMKENIVVDFHECRLFDNTVKPSVSTFVMLTILTDDDVIFGSELECDRFHVNLNQLHQALKFTVEKEKSNSLNFLDVSMEKGATGFLTSIYRKPKFTCQ